jgi:hypothetical protein
MRTIYIALGLMLAAGTAHAQTTVTRQVTTEPVETVVTQTPNETIVTRRPLQAAPAPLTYVPQAAERVITEPVVDVPAGFAPAAVVPAAPAASEVAVAAAPRPARVIATRNASQKSVRTQPRARHAVAARPRAVRSHGVARAPVARAAVVAQTVSAPLYLDAAQRQTIYRTIVQREVAPPPAAVVTAPATETVVTTTPSIVPPILEPLVPPILARPPILSRTEIVTQPSLAYAAPATTYVVGTRIPEAVALAPVPETIIAQMPATRAYRYAVVGSQVLLVDPATGVIVADLSQ